MGEEGLGAIKTDQDESKTQDPLENMNMQPVVILNDIGNSPVDSKVKQEKIVESFRNIYPFNISGILVRL